MQILDCLKTQNQDELCKGNQRKRISLEEEKKKNKRKDQHKNKTANYQLYLDAHVFLNLAPRAYHQGIYSSLQE